MVERPFAPAFPLYVIASVTLAVAVFGPIEDLLREW